MSTASAGRRSSAAGRHGAAGGARFVGGALSLVERGWVPDALVRAGIRRLLRDRLAAAADPGSRAAVEARMTGGPIPADPEAANRQHYELPPEFFRLVLGPRMKYSACLWPPGVDTLERAEEAALEQTCRRAGIADGARVLDLGCGWGSLALWIARRFPACRVTALSNAAPQGEHIRRRARELGAGVEVVTDGVDRFEPEAAFDRIVSVEMFEHLRHYPRLMRRIDGWLVPGGRLFVHHFCHRRHPYLFEDRGPSDWMTRHFFTAGLMPSEQLLEEHSGPLALERRWRLDGGHYRRTAHAWLANLDRHRRQVVALFERVYGEREARRWLHRWRLFFLACAEMFGWDGGREWFVSHTLWSPPPRSPRTELVTP